MSSKPTTLPQWSTDLSNATEPSLGQKQSGWTPGQDGVSDYDNWVKYWTYKWCEWLNDGDVSFDELTVLGSTTYTGAVDYTLTGTDVADPSGTGDTDAIHTILVTTSGGGPYILAGIVAGTNGREIDIVNDSDTDSFYMGHMHSSAAVGEKFSFPQPYQLSDSAGNSIYVAPRGSVRVRYNEPNDTWDVVSVTGCLVRRVFNFPATLASIPSGASHTRSTSHIVISGTGRISLPFTLPARSLMEKWNIYIKKRTDATNTVSGVMYNRAFNSDTENTEGSSDDDNSNAGGYVTLTNSPNGVISDSGIHYWLDINNTGNTSPANDWLLGADIFAWVPV